MAGNEEGGLENHFVALCNALAVRGADVTAIAHGKYANRFNEKVRFVALNLDKSRRNPLVLWRLYRTIARLRPDIVHAHANKAASMIAVLRRWLPATIRYVATLHSQKRNLKAFLRFDCVIGVSHRILEQLEHSCKRVIYNGSALPQVEATDVRKAFDLDAAPCVCGVGRLEQVKDFETLIDACAKSGVNALIVGEGSLFDALQKRIKRLGVQSRIRLIGYRKDVLSVVKGCDALVLSSLKEGLPYVVVEALLLRVPVIATDVSDMRRILPDEYVIPVGDKEALYERLKRLHTQKEAIRRAFEPVFEQAAELFSFERMIDDTIRIYQEVAKR
jgi:glycosyltransferase involved in cell wall biosynthesis